MISLKGEFDEYPLFDDGSFNPNSREDKIDEYPLKSEKGITPAENKEDS